MIRYIMISNPQFADINPRDCGEERCAPDFIVKNRRFSYMILHYAFSGGGTFEIEGIPHRLTRSHLSVVKPGQLVTNYADPADPHHYAWIGFECGVPLPPAFDRPVIYAPQAEPLFRDMLRSDQIAHGREHYLCAKIHELIVCVAQSDKDPDAKQLIVRAENYIKTHFHEPLCLDGIARSLSISTSYFCALFKRHTGKSPYRYLAETRLKRAAERIAVYGESVTDTAYAVGYKDIYSFSKAFKAFYGAAPTAFAQKFAGADI